MLIKVHLTLHNDELPDANPLMAVSMTEVLEYSSAELIPCSSSQILSFSIHKRLIWSYSTPARNSTMDVSFINDGVEVFFGLDDISVDMAGAINYQGENLSLDGQVLVDASAFVQLLSETVRKAVSASSLENTRSRSNVSRPTWRMRRFKSWRELGILPGHGENLPQRIFEHACRESSARVTELSLDSLFEPLQDISIEVDEGTPLGSAAWVLVSCELRQRS